ncbi:MAG: hypothetical protein KDL87_11275, partial [Verrucomicrobiae bacterium]|nr:hypothetical protein [Verrucomicrobiae bacterium]
MDLNPVPNWEGIAQRPHLAAVISFRLTALLTTGLTLGIAPPIRAQEGNVGTSATPPVVVSVPAPAETASDLPSDEAILKRLPELSTDYIRSLLGVYARLNNEKMTKELTAELVRRDPNGAEIESPESIANEAMEVDNDPPNPYEALENEIDALMTAQKYTEAIAKMEKLRTGEFAGRSFPFEIELGDAYGSVSDFNAAKAAYQRAANAAGASAEQKSLAAAGLAEIEKLEAVKVAYDLIQQRKPEEALRQAEGLRQKYPEDLDVQLLYAQALVPNYCYLEALPMLEAIKAKHFVGQPYPAQDALAEALRAMGRLDESRAAYEELSRDTTVPEHVRSEALVAAREVRQMRSPTVQGSAEFLSEGEGDGTFLRAHAGAPIGTSGLHAGVDTWYYDVDLTPERSIRQGSGDFLGAVAFVRQYLDDNLSYLEARAGGGDHGKATLGVTIGREQPYEGVLGYDLSLDINAPAIDSLQLIALNGIENRVSGNLVAPLPGRFEVTTGAWGRTVEADGADLGDGWGAYFQVGRTVWQNVKETAELEVAYRAEYERFDAARLSNREVERLGYAG